MATRTEEILELMEKILDEKDNRIEELEESVRSVENKEEEFESKIEELEDEAFLASPQTVLGELKKEICNKFMHLDIELLQELEKKHCSHLLGIEVNND